MLDGFLKRDVLIVFAQFRFGRGRKDRFGQLGTFEKILRQWYPADAAVLLILFPARSGNIATNDTFHWKWLGFFDQHTAAFNLVAVDVSLFREILYIGGNDVVWNNVGHPVEPEN